MNEPLLTAIWLIICILIGIASHFLPLMKAQSKIKAAWQNQNDNFQQWQLNFETEKRQFAEQKTAEHNSVSQKKTEAIQEYRKAINAIALAESIRKSASERVEQLEKRVATLQTALFNARKRAERLVNKSKKAENE